MSANAPDPNAAYLGGGDPSNPSLAPAAPVAVAPAAGTPDSDPTGLQALAGDVANTAEQAAPTLAQMAEDGVDILSKIATDGIVAGSIASISDVVALGEALAKGYQTLKTDVENFRPAVDKVGAFFRNLF